MEAGEIITAKILEWHKSCSPLTVGLCGPQGSGKSTISAHVAASLSQLGLKTAVLSLDDLYFDRPTRATLAATIHPLFATRGPPGTHDVALGIKVIDALRNGLPVALPRFDKGKDNPASSGTWTQAPTPCDVIVFEGWCVGAMPQHEAALIEPINILEQSEDPEARWRRAVNTALAGAYQSLWARIDRLVLLKAPDFSVVTTWRREQEQALINAGAPLAMSDTQIARFVQHCERLTRHIAVEMPGRADLVTALDHQRRVM